MGYKQGDKNALFMHTCPIYGDREMRKLFFTPF